MLVRLKDDQLTDKPNPTAFDFADSFEVLYQNMATISSLLEARNNFENSYSPETMSIFPYSWNRVKFEKGMWIDAKDTLEKWMEAVVLQTKGKSILVRYSGWDVKFDEWLTIDSHRIAPFRLILKQNIH